MTDDDASGYCGDSLEVVAEILPPPIEDISGDIDEETAVVFEDSAYSYSRKNENPKDSLTPDRLQKSIANDDPQALHDVVKNNPVVEEALDLFSGMVIDIHR